MLEWLIDLITSIVVWVLALFGIDYAAISEKKVDFAPTVEIVPPVEAVPLASATLAPLAELEPLAELTSLAEEKLP